VLTVLQIVRFSMVSWLDVSDLVETRERVLPIVGRSLRNLRSHLHPCRNDSVFGNHVAVGIQVTLRGVGKGGRIRLASAKKFVKY